MPAPRTTFRAGLAVMAAIDSASPPARPLVRGDCQGVQRPCGWHACKYNLVNVRRGRRAPDAPTCVLDVADRGGATLEEVGIALGLTRERVRQIVTKAMQNFAVAARRLR